MLGHAAQAVANAHLYASCHEVWPVRAEVARQRNPESWSFNLHVPRSPKQAVHAPYVAQPVCGKPVAASGLLSQFPAGAAFGWVLARRTRFPSIISSPTLEMSPQAPKSEVGELNLGLMSRLAHEVQPLKLQEPIRGCTGRQMKSKRCKPWALGAQKLTILEPPSSSSSFCPSVFASLVPHAIGFADELGFSF